VLSGGELPALVVIDAIARLLPGTLGSAESAIQESFSDGLLDWPHYTRPASVDGRGVPAVLASGDHAAIGRWRLQQSLGRTWLRRPDLLARRGMSEEERILLEEFKRAAAARRAQETVESLTQVMVRVRAMNKIIQQLNDERATRKLPDFNPGDTVVVQVKVVEGDRERVQAYEGVVIAKKNRGLNSSFTVRKISHGEGVERVFQTFSPSISEVSVKRRGSYGEPSSIICATCPARQRASTRRSDTLMRERRTRVVELNPKPALMGFFSLVWRMLEGVRKVLHLILLLVISASCSRRCTRACPRYRGAPPSLSPPRASWSSSCPAIPCAARSVRRPAVPLPRPCSAT